MASAISFACALTRAGVDALHVGRHRHGALAVVVLDARRTLVERDGRDLLERHHHVAARHRDRQMLDVGRIEAILGREANRDVARFADRIHPVADFDARERHAQRLRGIVDRDAELVREPAVELDAQLILGILLGQADVDRARDLPHLVHELVGELHELARIRAVELDLHRLARAIVEIVEHHVLRADELLTAVSRRSVASSPSERDRVALVADVDPHAAAGGVHAAVGGFDFGNLARELGGLFHLAARVFEAGARRRAHFDRERAVVGLRQEFACRRTCPGTRALATSRRPRPSAIHVR